MADVKIDGQTYTDVDMMNLEDTDGNEVKFYTDENLRLDYSTQLDNKPKINGVELDGDKTLEALGIPTGGGSGGNVAEWSDEQTFVLEEDVQMFRINFNKEYTEVIALLIPYKAKTATAGGVSFFFAENSKEIVAEIYCSEQGKNVVESGEGMIWSFPHYHIQQYGKGYKLERVQQNSVSPDSVYFSKSTHPYKNPEEVYSNKTGKITSLRFQTWVSGASFGAGTTVKYIAR